MQVLRGWAPPALLGLVVAFLGIGTVEVAGIAPRSSVTAPVASAAPVGHRPSLTPAGIEADERRVDAFPAPPTATAPAQPAMRPTGTAQPTPSPESEPSPEPTPTPSLSAPPRPTATPVPSLSPLPRQSPTSEPSSAPSSAPSAAPIARPKPTSKPAPARPAQILDLRQWKLTLPAGRPDHPAEIRQPALASLASGSFFRLTPDRGVAFRAPVGGVTTRNSSYPRSELREMSADGRREAGWSSATGTHVMTISQAITATPRAKPHVVAGQIHDGDDDVVMIRLEGRRLFVESDGDDAGVLDPHYRLGTKFTVSMVATRRGVVIAYNKHRTVRLGKVGRGWYFKAGCYPQSNPDRGDRPAAYGEVVIYALTVRHSAS